MIFINHSEALEGRITVVEVEGALNTGSSHDFDSYINLLLEKNKKFIVFDARKTDYISSAGIGLMIHIQKKISSLNGYFILANPSPEIRSLFLLLGFDKVLTLTESRVQALTLMENHIELRDHPAEASTAGTDILASQDFEILREEGELQEIPADTITEEELSGSSSSATPEIPVETEFSEPLIVECADCKSLIRVKKSGDYICPECHTEFTVEKDQTVIF